MSNNGKVGVVLPFNTPSLLFDDLSAKIFHPATLLISNDKRRSDFKFPHCFAGYSSVLFGVKMGFDVTMMVSSEDTVATKVLKACVDNFMDPENPFADILVQETGQTTIAGQLADFFAVNDGYDSALLVWPYQMFNVSEKLFQIHDGEAAFIYTHPLLKVNKARIPECVVVAPRDMNANRDMMCANALSVGTVDNMLKGSFTRILSAVEIDRDAFIRFTTTSLSPGDISVFLGEYLKGKRGILLDPESHNFIV